jgi:soluble lytic murein transglycosylase-like protein
MSLKKSLVNVALGLVVLATGVVGGWTAFSYHSDRVAGELRLEVNELREQNEEVHQENRRLNYVNDLAVEFSMNPMVIALVDRYSHQYLSKPGPEWRLLKTPEFLTYMVLSLIYAESKGNPNAVGDGGKARGLTQIWVSTARSYGDVTAKELLDPETNVSYSFKHFQHLLQKYKGNVALALYAWNRGGSTVDRLLAYGQSPENGYAKKVYEAALVNNRKLLHAN